MQIIRTYAEISEIIVTDEEEFNVYRRVRNDEWYYLIGVSWEMLFEYEQLEELYQKLND